MAVGEEGDPMHGIRSAVALAALGAGLLLGSASPAHASVTVDRAAAVANPMRFGTYYTIDACQYFGNSLTSGPTFSSYTCVQEYDQWYREYYWVLYVWFS
jgi:hypothetical protein